MGSAFSYISSENSPIISDKIEINAFPKFSKLVETGPNKIIPAILKAINIGIRVITNFKRKAPA